jgi:hypothetical protein
MIKGDMAVRDGDIYPYWPQNTEHVEIYGQQGVMCVPPDLLCPSTRGMSKERKI